MKKILFITAFTLILLIFVLCGCQETKTTAPESTSTDATEAILPADPPTGEIYHFASYEEWQSAVSESRSQAFQDTVAQNASGLVPMLMRLSQASTAPRPSLSHQPMKLIQVSLLEKELFDMPMILYHCDYNGIHVRIRVSYLSLAKKGSAEAKTDVAKFIQAIAPDFPNPDNYGSFDHIDTLADRSITVDGTSVLARVVNGNEGWYDQIHFLYDGYYVLIEAPELLSFDKGFFESFSID